jgi:hypothetical protein
MEKEHIIRVLKETKAAVKKEDIVRLKNLSNKTLHSASIEQDADSITLAVILYSLSKIIERKKYSYYEEWPSFYKKYMHYIHKAIIDLEEDDFEGFRRDINHIRKNINKLSGRFKKYIQDVFRKAEINKASRIYEHGISMEQTAKLLGVTIWELAEYSGQTGISDVDLSVTLPIKKRLAYAEEIFEKS